jgi:hypothetical protein
VVAADRARKCALRLNHGVRRFRGDDVDREEAEQLSVLLLQVVGRLDQSAAFVRDKESKAVWDEYRQAVGRAMAAVSLDLAEPLWRRHPDLRPQYLGGPYKVDPSIYQPLFYDPR